MPRTIIVTVGTSLLGNARRAAAGSAAMDIHALRAYLKITKRVTSSAEMNSLDRMNVDGGDDLLFIHSATDDAHLCAEALADYWESHCHGTGLQELKDVGPNAQKFRDGGLRGLVRVLVEQIARSEKAGRSVAINATGGYKVQIAYATLVGLLLKVPVYYIHETMNELMEVPAVPLGWDLSVIFDNEEFFGWLDEEPRQTTDVNDRKANLPGAVNMMLTDETDGCTYLSAVGEAIYGAYRASLAATIQVPIQLSSTARRTYDAASPAVRALFDRLIRGLRNRTLRDARLHSLTPLDLLAFPSGHQTARAVFYVQDDVVMVCDFFGQHTKYDAALAKRPMRASYSSFAPF